MKIGVFQFHGSGNVRNNYEAICSAIIEAARQKVRLLVFQECALCGYPPVEIPSLNEIHFSEILPALDELRALAKEYQIYLAIGTILEKENRRFNSMRLINPQGEIIGDYAKRALWGWDLDHYTEGSDPGIYLIDDLLVGFRICYEIRFPEYFRELFLAGANLCFVSFCDVMEQDNEERYNLIKAHLATRAVENVMTFVSVNSISKYQTAPTAVFSINGQVLAEAPKNQPYLLTFDFEIPPINFGAQGRIVESKKLLRKTSSSA